MQINPNGEIVEETPISTLFFPGNPHKNVRISIIVPVRNEASLLQKTLNALRCQYDPAGTAINPDIYEVLVLCNNCTDLSFEIASAYKRNHPDFALHTASTHLEKPHAHIGTVRRTLMDEACERFNRLGKDDGIIVSTDGDSEVDKNWIFHILREMDMGNDVVGGRILPKPVQTASRLYHLQDVSYRYLVTQLESVIDPSLHDPWPRHFQCYGPSLAVTCSMYKKAGRLPAIPFLEDEEFRKALHRVDARIRKSPHVKVYTSSRLEGQVDFGFSVQLQKWAEMKLSRQQQQVESLPALLVRLQNKKLLRNCWQNIRKNPDAVRPVIEKIAAAFFIEEKWLLQQCLSATYFGTLWENFETSLMEGDWFEQNLPVNISEAIIHLRAYLNTYSFSNTSIR